MSDYTQTLNTLESMDPYAPVPIEILSPAIQDLLLDCVGDRTLGFPIKPGDMTVSEALRYLLRDWGTVPNVVYGLNGPDTYFDTWGAEQALIRAWLTDNGIDPATVCTDPMYFDHSNNDLTYAEYDPVLAPQVKHMTQHTMQGAPIASLLPTY